MRKKLQIWLAKRWRWYGHLKMFVIMDARDNSVTLSNLLCERMKVWERTTMKVMVFYEREAKEYGFCVNPALDVETQMADVQYNAKYKCVGFESLVPTVTRIFYDYGIDKDVVRLSVEERKACDMTYWSIRRPNR